MNPFAAVEARTEFAEPEVGICFFLPVSVQKGQIAQREMFLRQNDHREKTACHGVAGMQGQCQKILVDGEKHAVVQQHDSFDRDGKDGFQIPCPAEVAEAFRHFGGEFVAERQDADTVIMLVREGVQREQKLKDGFRRDLFFSMLIAFDQCGVSGLFCGGGGGGVFFEFHLPDGFRDFVPGDVLRMQKNAVDGFDHRNGGAIGTGQSCFFQSGGVESRIAVTAEYGFKQFGIAVPPLIDRLFDVADVEEGAEAVLIRLKNLVDEIGNRAPLFIGGVLEFVEKIVVVLRIQALFEHRVVREGQREGTGAVAGFQKEGDVLERQAAVSADRIGVGLIELPEEIIVR